MALTMTQKELILLFLNLVAQAGDIRKYFLNFTKQDQIKRILISLFKRTCN